MSPLGLVMRTWPVRSPPPIPGGSCFGWRVYFLCSDLRNPSLLLDLGRGRGRTAGHLRYVYSITCLGGVGHMNRTQAPTSPFPPSTPNWLPFLEAMRVGHCLASAVVIITPRKLKVSDSGWKTTIYVRKLNLHKEMKNVGNRINKGKVKFFIPYFYHSKS